MKAISEWKAWKWALHGEDHREGGKRNEPGQVLVWIIWQYWLCTIEITHSISNASVDLRLENNYDKATKESNHH